MALKQDEPHSMPTLTTGDSSLDLSPERGGSVLRFDWRGMPIFRPARGPGILDVASFPLVPFSNRVAFGRFTVAGRKVALAPNFPDSDHPHPLHGFGWLAQWDVVALDERHAVLEHRYTGGEWPWPYVARQRFDLYDDGLEMSLSVTNLSDEAMPAGLGFHPYFPGQADTHYHGLHHGEWRNGPTGLPLAHEILPTPQDWWHGSPISSRAVDTLYTNRQGALRIEWPSRRLALKIAPSQNLPHTAIYSPAGMDFFCVEPVSHVTNAVNMDDGRETGLRYISPGEAFAGSIELRVAQL